MAQKTRTTKIVSFALLLSVLSFPACAGLVDDVLKYNERISASKKEIICANLQKQLADTERKKKELLDSLKMEVNQSQTLEDNYQLLSLTKIQGILKEQITLNACGGKK